MKWICIRTLHPTVQIEPAFSSQSNPLLLAFVMTFLLLTALTVMRIITVPLRNTQTDKARQKEW